jgi:hypothetical protein
MASFQFSNTKDVVFELTGMSNIVRNYTKYALAVARGPKIDSDVDFRQSLFKVLDDVLLV